VGGQISHLAGRQQKLRNLADYWKWEETKRIELWFAFPFPGVLEQASREAGPVGGTRRKDAIRLWSICIAWRRKDRLRESTILGCSVSRTILGGGRKEKGGVSEWGETGVVGEGFNQAEEKG